MPEKSLRKSGGQEGGQAEFYCLLLNFVFVWYLLYYDTFYFFGVSSAPFVQILRFLKRVALFGDVT